MKISLLVPSYNEERSIEACIQSCLNQTRQSDEIVFIDDGSTDRTPNLLARYADKIIIKRTPRNTGNKSRAQQYGMQFITGDVVVMTDGDTMLDARFVEHIEKKFADPDVAAVAGYVKSMPYNWLTLCRAFEYSIGQNIHKLAQSYIDYIFVMPGAASAFRMNIFRDHINFDHDTITEDLDFTYKLHHKHLKIQFCPAAISYTQDPTTLHSYINQMRRWYGGGWQNLLKHYNILKHPLRAFELALIYTEGIIFSVLLFVLPLINIWGTVYLLRNYLLISLVFALFAAIKEKRPTLLLAPFPFLIIAYINAYIYLEQFVKEIVLKRRNLVWFKPERIITTRLTKHI